MIIRRLLVFVISLYLVLVAFFTYQIHRLSASHLPLQVDAIIVVTGQSGRIEAGEKLLTQYPCPLLISGAGAQVKKEDIFKNTSILSRIILGHFAKNTAENGQEIKQWIQQYNLQSIIIISHNYHLPRLLLYLEKTPHIIIYPYAISARLSTGRFFAEMHKYYYSILFSWSLEFFLKMKPQ